MGVEPSERGVIQKGEKNLSDLQDFSALSIDGLIYHIQGIAEIGDEYIVLSTSANDKALILAKKEPEKNEYKIMHVAPLPGDKYEHAGGIDVLEGEDKCVIVVPVWARERNEACAILFYSFCKNQAKLVYKGAQKIKETPYAVGIARTQDDNDDNVVVVIAVVIDSDGNSVLFATCSDRNGLSGYSKVGKVWRLKNADRDNWKPNRNWGSNYQNVQNGQLRRGYPNSISLIEHGGQIYFVGMHNTNDRGTGKDCVDLYRVNQTADNKRLIKVGHEHVTCDSAEIKIDINFLPIVSEENFAKSFFGPSFRWGGSARMQKGILEVIAVERNFYKNQVRYNKFYLEIDEKNENDQLTQCVQLGEMIIDD